MFDPTSHAESNPKLSHKQDRHFPNHLCQSQMPRVSATTQTETSHLGPAFRQIGRSPWPRKFCWTISGF